MKVPEDFEPVSKEFSEAGHKEKLEWIDIDGSRKYYPEFFRPELRSSCDGVNFITSDERKG